MVGRSRNVESQRMHSLVLGKDGLVIDRAPHIHLLIVGHFLAAHKRRQIK
jgi:hypothetical protein